MDLTTRYLGLDLPHPLIAGASPLAGDLGTARRLEDAGAAALVVHSLFEEQLAGLPVASLSYHAESAAAEPPAVLPVPVDFARGPEAYLEHLIRLRHAVDIPIIASLNGTTWGGWLEYATLIEKTGVDALELNVYQLATDPERDGATVEAETLAIVGELTSSLKLPVAVKLSPYYTSMAHLARRLADVGAAGLVLFNRFYQPDIDLDALAPKISLRLSDPSELPLRLRWLAILSSQVDLDFAVTGGVHSADDAMKATLVGAHAVQIVSALLRRGPEVLSEMRRGLAEWLEKRGLESLSAVRGQLDFTHASDPSAYERANYMSLLHSWDGYLPAKR